MWPAVRVIPRFATADRMDQGTFGGGAGVSLLTADGREGDVQTCAPHGVTAFQETPPGLCN